MQDQLRQAKESVMNMQKLHDLAQSQMFELRAQSGTIIVLDTTTLLLFHFFSSSVTVMWDKLQPILQNKLFQN